MDNLKQLSKGEVISLIKEGKVGAADLTDSGICPTCFNRENDEVLYGDNTEKVIYEDDMFECFLVGNPRAVGHVAISSKKHFKTCNVYFIISSANSRTDSKIYNN